jgi:hypothetical protein
MSGRPTASKNPLSTPPIGYTPDRISNREALRLETLATQTKQRTQPRSNREKAEVFALSLPPMGPAKPPNSNRDTILLETHANS